MFIPGIYKSVPQVLAGTAPGFATPTDLTITTVDPSYTRLSLQGWYGGGSGNVDPSQYIAKVKDATHITISGTGAYSILVEEYISAFFRQAFQYGVVTVAATATSGSTAHGLTLGSKAFVIWLGNESSRAADSFLGLALTEAQVRSTVAISGANIVATVGQADYVGAPGTVTVQYLLVDPR